MSVKTAIKAFATDTLKKTIMRQLRILLLGLVLVLICSQCSNPKTSESENTPTSGAILEQTDPFAKTITERQYFELDSKIDNVIEGKEGTIIVCPKGCFINAKGEVVEGNVKIELAEALSLEEMILSNLTTTSNGKLLETDGMIYFNATVNGENVTINNKNPIHIEIPTKNKKEGMSVYKGIRDSLGNMNWVDPKPIENYLLTIDAYFAANCTTCFGQTVPVWAG